MLFEDCSQWDITCPHVRLHESICWLPSISRCLGVCMCVCPSRVCNCVCMHACECMCMCECVSVCVHACACACACAFSFSAYVPLCSSKCDIGSSVTINKPHVSGSNRGQQDHLPLTSLKCIHCGYLWNHVMSCDVM